MHLSLSAKLGKLPVLFSAPVRDYFSRLDAAGLRVREYDQANARLIDRLVANGGNFWPDSGAFNAMAGYLYPGNGEDLIPLKDGHDAGTLNAFVTGDWNAVTGLKGDGSTKYVDSNRLNDADGQDDNHASAFFTQINAAGASRRDVIGANSGIRYITTDFAIGRYITRNNNGGGGRMQRLSRPKLGCWQSAEAQRQIMYSGAIRQMLQLTKRV